MKRYVVMVLVLGLSCWLTGCEACFPFGDSDWDNDDSDWDNDDWWEQAGTNTSPRISVLQEPGWRPLGPDDSITFEVWDQEGLYWIEVVFGNAITRHLAGTRESIVSFLGDELGEGLGVLAAVVADPAGNSSEAFVYDLLVDLTPPVVEVSPTHLRADGEGPNGQIRLWIGDAWILGRVTLEFNGETLEHAFPEGRPSTLGETWDRSVVAFSAADLPEGVGQAEVTVIDAAGNQTVSELELNVDGTPPEGHILEPEPGAILADSFWVTVQAVDFGGGAVWIEILAAGVKVADAAGPTARVRLDANEFTPGQLTLSAVMIDGAGNRAETAEVVVNIE